jgi:hypothetical protein
MQLATPLPTAMQIPIIQPNTMHLAQANALMLATLERIERHLKDMPYYYTAPVLEQLKHTLAIVRGE